MQTRTIMASLVAAIFMILLTVAVAVAQDGAIDPAAAEPPGETIGAIPGTGMMRDEFRARAEAQLAALARNALVYFVVHGEYPAGYYELRGSDAWNLDIINMFTGRQLNAIYFEPEPEDMTRQPMIGLPYFQNVPPPPLAPPPTDDEGGIDASALSGMIGGQGLSAASRVDPAAILSRDFGAVTGGDVFYYVDGEMLQLIMYAPDGTYVERVEEVPNHNWRMQLTSPGEASHWPDDAFAAQVLYYTGTLLTQYYNLVLFMGDNETIPTPELNMLGADDRLAIAGELGIVILNPFTKSPAKLAVEFSPGDFIEPDPLVPVPLYICMRDNRVTTHAELRSQEEQPVEPPVPAAVEKPKPGSGRPPMGGRK